MRIFRLRFHSCTRTDYIHVTLKSKDGKKVKVLMKRSDAKKAKGTEAWNLCLFDY